MMSGQMVAESARIDGEQITAITQSRIDATLEGYEPYGIEIDDQMAINMCDDIVQSMKQMAFKCKGPRFGSSSMHQPLQSPHAACSRAHCTTQKLHISV
jgi:hypothetical protein